jgi:phosphoserine phosphatase RsbU/P
MATPVRKNLEELHHASLPFHQDMQIAREVQRASFPQQPPAIPGLKCASFYRPAHLIGGDYYDFIPLADNVWGIAIGDVSGKGIGAALVMANLQGSLRAQALQPRSELEMRMSHVNRLIWKSSPQHFFVSLLYAEYEPSSHLLRYVNAGHNAPIVLRRNHGRCELLMLTPECVPLGLLEDSLYTSKTFQLEIGDILVAYTDGITELENSEGNQFGREQLERLLYRCRSQDPHEVLQEILRELSVYSAGGAPTDDITLIVMQLEARTDGDGC